MSCVIFGRTGLLYTFFFVLTCLLMSSPGGCGDTEKDGRPATPFASASLATSVSCRVALGVWWVGGVREAASEAGSRERQAETDAGFWATRSTGPVRTRRIIHVAGCVNSGAPTGGGYSGVPSTRLLRRYL